MPKAPRGEQQYVAALYGAILEGEGELELELEGGLAALTLSEKSLPSGPGEIESYLRASIVQDAHSRPLHCARHAASPIYRSVYHRRLMKASTMTSLQRPTCASMR